MVWDKFRNLAGGGFFARSVKEQVMAVRILLCAGMSRLLVEVYALHAER